MPVQTQTQASWLVFRAHLGKLERLELFRRRLLADQSRAFREYPEAFYLNPARPLLALQDL
jgi:hypothetical protein